MTKSRSRNLSQVSVSEVTVSTTSLTIGKQRISPKSDLKKIFLPTPTTLDQTPSDYAGLVVVAVFKISSKYVGIIRSLATRSTLSIPKLFKCINKAQPERSHAYENRVPEPEPFHFYKSSAALIRTMFL